MHIDAENRQCQPLKINGDKMNTSNQEKYLGDFIDKTGSFRPNIEHRKSKGHAIILTIMAIINEIPLAHWKVQAWLILRQALLMNRILFNSEAWYGVDKKDIVILEKVDKALFRGVISAHPKISIGAL